MGESVWRTRVNLCPQLSTSDRRSETASHILKHPIPAHACCAHRKRESNSGCSVEGERPREPCCWRAQFWLAECFVSIPAGG